MHAFPGGLGIIIGCSVDVPGFYSQFYCHIDPTHRSIKDYKRDLCQVSG